ncbi:lytic murein transglycosylase [Aquibium sp. ELW1220]|uniref:lytic murein transglycosylase n=1 Tax=Aquibium sp. ELW1220 TaxID=2976766 RepID=UPI0025AFF93C|nr:lytic murein transglycosylase [Aquibium sp. ELW1220]MDN2579955.1 lytic murein transglycosylase [Aquibium sp. ELW1220]
MELMPKGKLIASALLAMVLGTGGAHAAQCGNNSSGFNAWKQSMAQEASRAGVGQRGLAALQGASYSNATISADRNQKSFKYSLEKFMQVRGAPTIVSRGKKLKAQNAQLFSSIEARYGVPAGPLLAIWGMETAFGGFMGDTNLISATATLAYDCRRSEFFTGHLMAALQLVDRGVVSSSSVGAKHGELGQTQFLPGSVLRYGVDGDGDGKIDLVRSRADALASTANFLRAHGWRPGAGYQPGQANYGAIQGWNAAGVYQQAIAIMGKQIDG